MRKTIPITIYYTCIDLRVVDNVNRCMKRIYEKNKWEIDGEYPDNKDNRGLAFNFTADRYYLILNKGQLTHGLISHELLHIIDEIATQKGRTEVDGTYLIETVTDAIYAFLESKRIAVK